jgi:hypothetical protein
MVALVESSVTGSAALTAAIVQSFVQSLVVEPDIESGFRTAAMAHLPLTALLQSSATHQVTPASRWDGLSQ